jgi:formylglycine-generating enzyme required for sulfatase activity
MTNITWDEAADFCGWAGGSLPTEAQWEYAARAGSSSARYGPLDNIGWYSDNSAIREPGVYIRAINEPAQKLPNLFGTYDMLGNAMEWVADWYDPDYYSYGTKIDPPGPSGTGLRVYRGACSDNKLLDVRVSYRNGLDPERRIYIFGFRCTWAAPIQSSQ